MPKTQQYTVVLFRDSGEGTYTVLVPALPGCVTVGDTVDEALANAREAIEGHLQALQDVGDELPDEPEDTFVAAVTVEVPTPGEAEIAAAG